MRIIHRLTKKNVSDAMALAAPKGPLRHRSLLLPAIGGRAGRGIVRHGPRTAGLHGVTRIGAMIAGGMTLGRVISERESYAVITDCRVQICTEIFCLFHCPLQLDAQFACSAHARRMFDVRGVCVKYRSPCAYFTLLFQFACCRYLRLKIKTARP